KIYAQGLRAQGFRQGGFEGLPRFASSTFEAAYPFGRVRLTDPAVPLDVQVTGFNPFIPGDDRNSGIPCAILEYTFHNPGRAAVDFDFSFHASHLAVPGGRWKQTRNAVIKGFGVHLYNTAPQ